MHIVDPRELLAAHCALGVPLQHSVALLSRLRGVSLAHVARRAGCHRNGLYQALVGQVQPSARLRQALLAELGVDPWEIHLAGEGARG